MNTYHYPLNLKFKVTTLANDFVVTDAQNRTVSYVRQKMFKFVDEVDIYSDETKSSQTHKIKANKWIDFSAAYAITNHKQENLGKVARKGWASIWKSKYEIFDAHDQHKFVIRERNAWVKVMDSMFGEIPLIGVLSGYVFNPKYDVKDLNNQVVFTLSKKPSFFGRKFELTKTTAKELPEDLILLSLKMMLILERRRG